MVLGLKNIVCLCNYMWFKAVLIVLTASTLTVTLNDQNLLWGLTVVVAYVLFMSAHSGFALQFV